MNEKKLGGQYPSLGIPPSNLGIGYNPNNGMGSIPEWVVDVVVNQYDKHLEQGRKKMNSGLFNPAPPNRAQMASATLTQEMAFNLLGGRLRIPQGHVLPFDHLSIHLGPEKVTVFVMATGGPVILEDTTALFPSDDLIGKLLLLRG